MDWAKAGIGPGRSRLGGGRARSIMFVPSVNLITILTSVPMILNQEIWPKVGRSEPYCVMSACPQKKELV